MSTEAGDTERHLHRRLVHELAAVQAGMLGVAGSDLHPRPMFHLTIPGEPVLWFLAEADSDLHAAIGAGATANYCLTGHRHDFHACLTGTIRPAPDRQGLERVWSVAAEARFPGGLADLDWMPLRMDMTEAAVWTSPAPAVLTGMDLILSGLPDAAPETTDPVARQAVLRLAGRQTGESSNI